MPAKQPRTKPILDTVPGVMIYRPIVYGSVSTKIPDAPQNGLTHSWVCGVYGANGFDISHFIKRIVFKLHSSFPDPVRSVETPPFEVHEHGWGEFQITITIYFHHCNAHKTLHHDLKINHYMGGAEEIRKATEENRPVKAFQYDDIIFQEPTEAMYKTLTDPENGNVLLPKADRFPWMFSQEYEEEELEKLNQAYEKVQSDVNEMRDKLLEREKELAREKERMAGSVEQANRLIERARKRKRKPL